MESGIDAAQRKENPDHQARPDQQCQRESNLDSDQQIEV